MSGRVLSYGEDPLTFWVLTARLGEVLGQLHDPSPPEQAVVFYRPSFGRHGRAKDPRDARGPRAEFGEFDAILGTHSATYLIESKWTGSSEAKGEALNLREEQIHRHRILRWYLETWRGKNPPSWDAFIGDHDHFFRMRFSGNKMAPLGTALAQNLEFVFRRLGDCGTRVRDVILYIGSAGSVPRPSIPPAGFTLVTIVYEPLTTTGYFEMT